MQENTHMDELLVDYEKEAVFEIKKMDDSNVEIIATNEHGVVRTKIFLWPREIFE